MYKSSFVAILLAGLLTSSYTFAEKQAGKEQKVDETQLIKNMSDKIIFADQAVACSLRDQNWLRVLAEKYVASLRMELRKVYKSDDELNQHTMNIIRSAKAQAALHARQGPSFQECNFIKNSEALREMDAEVKAGKSVDETNI